MPAPAGKKPPYPNPFYVLVVLAGIAFVATAAGWLAAPMIQEKARRRPGEGAGAVAIAAWFDRWSVTTLTVELVVLIVAGLLAMLADRWFRGDTTS
jgi:hypothetical protein